MTVFVYGTPIIARDRDEAEEELVDLFEHLVKKVGVENRDDISPVWFVELGPPELGPIPREAMEAMISALPPDRLTVETPRDDKWSKAGIISRDCLWGESALHHFGAPHCRTCRGCDWGPSDTDRGNLPKPIKYPVHEAGNRYGGFLVIGPDLS